MIILISLILISPNFLQKIFVDYKLIDVNLYFLIFIPFFSKYILKQEIYKHQYLSIIVSIIGMILLHIPLFLVFQQNDILPNILHFVGGVFRSTTFVLVKYIFNTFFMSPFKFCVLLGIIMIILHLFIFLVYSLIKYHDLSYFNDSLDLSEAENKVKAIIYIILFFIFASSYRIFRFIVIFYFSPILYMVTVIITKILSWLLNTIRYESAVQDIVLCSIGYFILLFSSLIYNEIIILNFCGLNKNTKIFVEYRQNEELIELEKNQNEIVLQDLKIIDNDNISVNSDYYLTKNN